MVHWGDENEIHASLPQKDAAQVLIDQGADVVIGVHPHVVQETAILVSNKDEERIGFVAYSLGNFIFDQYDELNRPGLGVRLFIDKSGLAAVEALPLLSGVEPRWAEGIEAQKLIERIRPAPKVVSYRCTIKDCQSIDTPDKGIKKSQSTIQIDLTGDGNEEIVQFTKNSVKIYEYGMVKWQSDKGWIIQDMSVGDPNNDGRNEIILALNKKDDSGEPKSHPFIVGYRGGIYRQIWGGSAVRYPISELELLDLDSDRSEELVVLEKRSNCLRAITIWKWNGWIFSQIWSSPEGRYEGLKVSKPGEETHIISVGKIW